MIKEMIFFRKSDFIVILILCLIPVFINVLFESSSTRRCSFKIKRYIDGKKIIENFDFKDKIKVVQGKIGSLIVEFDETKGVRVASSTCPCQVCVHTGWTKSESVVCVPNAVIIQPTSDKENNFDAVTR